MDGASECKSWSIRTAHQRAATPLPVVSTPNWSWLWFPSGAAHKFPNLPSDALATFHTACAFACMNSSYFQTKRRFVERSKWGDSTMFVKKYPRYSMKTPLNIHWSSSQVRDRSQLSTRILDLTKELANTESIRSSAACRNDASSVKLYNFESPDRTIPWL